MKIKLFFISIFIFFYVKSQHTTIDLTANFHKERRDKLKQMLPDHSMAVIFANPERNRSNDVYYEYHQNTDFYYLTGFKEANSVLILFSETQLGGYNEILFVQPNDTKAEMWNGKRLGVDGAKKNLGILNVLSSIDFHEFQIEDSIKRIFFTNLRDDVEDFEETKYDLKDLISSFKKKLKVNDEIYSKNTELYEAIRTTNFSNSATVAKIIDFQINSFPSLKNDEIISDFLKIKSESELIEIQKNLPPYSIDGESLNLMLNILRETKLDEELSLIKKAVEISCNAQIEVMKAITPNMTEKEIQGMHEYIHKKYGAAHVGYPSIIGSGSNGCILHYTENTSPLINNQLVLMDVGAEYKNYTADITRTVPANGKFTTEQSIIYNIVLKAQEAAINVCKPNIDFFEPGRIAKKIIAEELLKLNIIKDPNEVGLYFPHGTSHHIGLDVHDRSNFGPLKPNMVITIEPGIYIPEGSNCNKKWWGIGVRIEDDILITENGFVNLSEKAPRKIEEIEEIMKEQSPFNEFQLPELK